MRFEELLVVNSCSGKEYTHKYAVREPIGEDGRAGGITVSTERQGGGALRAETEMEIGK